MGIRIRDHVVIGDGTFRSFAEEDLLRTDLLLWPLLTAFAVVPAIMLYGSVDTLGRLLKE